MSHTNKKGKGRGWLFWYIPLLLAEFAWFIALLLRHKNIAIVNPKGVIAHQQLGLLIFTTIVLCVAAIPTVLFLYFTAWKYRESNTKVSRYSNKPSKHHSKRFLYGIWGFPTIVMLVLLVTLYPATHRLEPRKAVASNNKPMTIQVVSMRWKWVFLYPEQKIATVNFVQIPANTPVQFELTADEAPMSSFWIPNIAGQLYSMTGHVNRLNVQADTVGDYTGSSAEINGPGFAGMKFTTRVSSAEDFASWTEGVKQYPQILNTKTYENLVKPSEDNPAAFYSSYQNDLYETVVNKYAGAHAGHMHEDYQ